MAICELIRLAKKDCNSSKASNAVAEGWASRHRFGCLVAKRSRLQSRPANSPNSHVVQRFPVHVPFTDTKFPAFNSFWQISRRSFFCSALGTSAATERISIAQELRHVAVTSVAGTIGEHCGGEASCPA